MDHEGRIGAEVCIEVGFLATDLMLLHRRSDLVKPSTWYRDIENAKNDAVSKMIEQDWHGEANFSDATARERQDALANVFTIAKDYETYLYWKTKKITWTNAPRKRPACRTRKRSSMNGKDRARDEGKRQCIKLASS